jgi:mRNA interferase RelE/StbE
MFTSRSAVYDLFILPPAHKDLDQLESRAFERIIGKIRDLSKNARPTGCLKLTGEEGYRVRVGEYRVLYRIDDTHKRLYIYRVKHRKEAYT